MIEAREYRRIHSWLGACQPWAEGSSLEVRAERESGTGPEQLQPPREEQCDMGQQHAEGVLTQVCALPPRASFPCSKVWLVFSMGQVVARTQSSPQGLWHSRHLLKFSFFFFGTDTEMNLTL